MRWSSLCRTQSPSSLSLRRPKPLSSNTLLSPVLRRGAQTKHTSSWGSRRTSVAGKASREEGKESRNKDNHIVDFPDSLLVAGLNRIGSSIKTQTPGH